MSAFDRRQVKVGAVYALISCAFALAIWGGIEGRRWVWDATEPIRFRGDINNAFNQGKRANQVGYRNVYDIVVEQAGTRRALGLDYPPLRLLVVTRWVAWMEQHEPGIARWRNEYALTLPMLRLNLAMELASAAGMFLLVRLWVRRQGTADDKPSEPRAALLGAAAAMLLWFNPAVVLNAHGWPQWDVWAVPFFIWALLMAGLSRFGVAGALIALGAMLKGQLLLVAPLLVLLPLLRGQWAGLLRLFIGFGLGVVACTWVWLLPDGAALKTAGGIAGLIALACWAVSRRGVRSAWVWTAAGAGVVAGVGIAAWVHQGSMGWFYIGFSQGTRQYMRMSIGQTSNLAGLLGAGWSWRPGDVVALPWIGWEPTMRTLLLTAYGLTLAWCGLIASRCDAHRRTMFLVAATLPWVAMFALLPQMHERYLLWGAACSAAWVALGTGPTLLHLLITAQAFVQILYGMLGFNRRQLPGLRSALDATMPGSAWAMLLLLAVVLWWMTHAHFANKRLVAPLKR